jgi:hypothetical protein
VGATIRLKRDWNSWGSSETLLLISAAADQMCRMLLVRFVSRQQCGCSLILCTKTKRLQLVWQLSLNTQLNLNAGDSCCLGWSLENTLTLGAASAPHILLQQNTVHQPAARFSPPQAAQACAARARQRAQPALPRGLRSCTSTTLTAAASCCCCCWRQAQATQPTTCPAPPRLLLQLLAGKCRCRRLCCCPLLRLARACRPE